MKNVRELLRDTDPLVYENGWTPAERHIVRQSVLDHVLVEPKPSRRSFAYGLVAAVATLASVIIGSDSFRVGVIAAVRFEVRLAEDSPGLELDQATVGTSGERIYVHRQPVLTNGDIASAETVQDANGAYSVVVRFTRDGAAKLLRTTTQSVGRRLALLLDGQVVVASNVRSPISTSAVISGGYTKSEADRIAVGMVGR